MSALVIGVDPGRTTGVCVINAAQPDASPLIYQANGNESAWVLIEHLIDDVDQHGIDVFVAIEKFVVSTRAGRSRTAAAGEQARELIASFAAVGVHTFSRNAATVKAWATDSRLVAAGLFVPTVGMPHARDACRHALYAAVHQGYATDPLSKS